LFGVAAGKSAGLCHSSSPPNKKQKRGSAMSIDFEIPAEAKAIREKGPQMGA
jgi:hypothetical protein